MSLDHKAFLFDSDGFDQELRLLLGASLCSKSIDQIRTFIQSNKSSLTAPYKGEPLEGEWDDMIEDKD